MIVKNMDVRKNKQSKSRLNKGKLRKREILRKSKKLRKIEGFRKNERNFREWGVPKKRGKTSCLVSFLGTFHSRNWTNTRVISLKICGFSLHIVG